MPEARVEEAITREYRRSPQEYVTQYLGQLRYTNALLIEAIDAIDANDANDEAAQRPTVVVVSSGGLPPTLTREGIGRGNPYANLIALRVSDPITESPIPRQLSLIDALPHALNRAWGLTSRPTTTSPTKAKSSNPTCFSTDRAPPLLRFFEPRSRLAGNMCLTSYRSFWHDFVPGAKTPAISGSCIHRAWRGTYRSVKASSNSKARHCSVSNPNLSSSSMLGAVVQHERDLRAQREAARAEARSIVEQAHVDAARVQDELNKTLSDEIVALHEQAEAARAAERTQLMADAQARVEAERAQARTKVADAVGDIVAMVLPSRKAEG